jgi:hypothetical protein
MIFHILTREQKLEKEKAALSMWHKKFAWLPTRMDHDINKVIWLEFILRKGKVCKYIHGLFGPIIIWEWAYVESTFDVLKMDLQK